MQILSLEIQKFIQELKELGTIGCLLVSQAGLEKLLAAFAKASAIIGPEVQPGRVTHYNRTGNDALGSIEPPALLVVTEEDYSKYPEWAQEIRDQASYFLNVKG